jgi:hypothetical protein
MITTSIERLEAIEAERQETIYSQAFQQWTSSLNVSRLAPNPEPLIKARILNSQYDYERKNKVASLIKRIYL